MYHCTWHRCHRPVLALTLCRHHYRAYRVSCAWPHCSNLSHCRQVCAAHYRKKQFPPVNYCTDCHQPSYIDNKCFYHYTARTCIQCNHKVFSKQLCQKHYMRQWRTAQVYESESKSGCTKQTETSPETSITFPTTNHHNPETHSSLRHKSDADISL